VVNIMVKDSKGRPAAPTTKTRIPRGTLSRAGIVEAAFRLVDADTEAQLSMSRLGRELGADPSAVYRHFRSKDELLRAMADVMMQDALADVGETDDPLENIRVLVWALRRSFLRRPALTRVLMARYTGGDAEEAWGLTVLRNVEALGFDERASVVVVRCIGEVATSHMTLSAEVLALPEPALAVDLERAMNLVGDEPVRLKGTSGEELRALAAQDADFIFGRALELLLAGIAAQAPTPRRRPAPRKAAGSAGRRR
jgi:AcrR family transcriptional regulator